MKIKNLSKPDSIKVKELLEQLRVLALDYKENYPTRLEIDFEVPKNGEFYHSKRGVAMIEKRYYAVSVIEVTFGKFNIETKIDGYRGHFDREKGKWVKSQYGDYRHTSYAS